MEFTINKSPFAGKLKEMSFPGHPSPFFCGHFWRLQQCHKLMPNSLKEVAHLFDLSLNI